MLNFEQAVKSIRDYYPGHDLPIGDTVSEEAQSLLYHPGIIEHRNGKEYGAGLAVVGKDGYHLWATLKHSNKGPVISYGPK